MSKNIKRLGMVGVLVLVAACENNKEEYVVVEPEPISVEPVSTGKYK